MSTVLVRNTTEEHIAKAIDEIFELYQVDLRGKKVLIKPNMLGPHSPEKAATTHPVVVKAIVDKVLTQTNHVVVGDNPMAPDLSGRLNETAKITGILDAAAGYYQNLGSEVEFRSIGSETIDGVYITKKVLDADYFINVPKLKTHLLTGITGCVKNLFGLVPGTSKSGIHYQLRHAKALTQFFLDLYKFATPNLNIVDAIIGMEGDGPTSGTPRRIGKLIAGINGVEVDAVLAAMMGIEPTSKVKTLDLAYKQGLGEINLGAINLLGDFEVLADFALPVAYVAPQQLPQTHSMEEIHQMWGQVAKAIPELHADDCIQCGACEEICPADAMKLDPLPIIDEEKCISCFCCAERCAEGALVMPAEEVTAFWSLFE